MQIHGLINSVMIKILMSYLISNITKFHQQETKGACMKGQVLLLIQYYIFNMLFQKSLVVRGVFVFIYLKNWKIQWKGWLIFKMKIMNTSDGVWWFLTIQMIPVNKNPAKIRNVDKESPKQLNFKGAKLHVHKKDYTE